MANEKQLIRVLTEPTIVLDDIVAQDVEEGTSTQLGSPTSNVKYSKQYGGLFPLVQINERVFSSSQIVSAEIYCTGVIPTATVRFNVNDKSFYSTSFPKDGDLMSIFIRSKNDLFKPIRNDYEITSVSVRAQPRGGENTTDDMTISGVLRIPGYHATKCFSKKGTSMNAILKVATDLSLGFASNEIDTSDTQTWICPYDKVSEFLYNTALAAWKDTKSFFYYFIDHYYYLNFVNVEPLFSEKTEIEESLSRELLTQDFGTDSEIAEAQGKTILTNWDDLKSTPFFIQSYSLQNSSALINNMHGYRRYAMFYDALTQESERIYVDPLTTDGAEKTEILLKGRPGEDFYKQQVQAKWMGVQYGSNGENCHEKYNLAMIMNYQNNVHLNKMSLLVKLQNPNFNLRRMQSIPVIIVVKQDMTRKIINEPIDEDEQASPTDPNDPNKTKPAVKAEDVLIVLDKTITGNYVIQDMVYKYEKGQFRQECTLIRREWATPPMTH